MRLCSNLSILLLCRRSLLRKILELWPEFRVVIGFFSVASGNIMLFQRRDGRLVLPSCEEMSTLLTIPKISRGSLERAFWNVIVMFGSFLEEPKANPASLSRTVACALF